MGDDTVFEAIKTIGGISGICTAIFLVMDRFTKHYPVAIIVARPLSEGSANIVPSLLLKNLSERPILLSWADGNSTQLRIAKGQSVRAIMMSLFEGETTIALSPKAEATLPLFKPSTYDDIDAENMLASHPLAVCSTDHVARSPKAMDQNPEARLGRSRRRLLRRR